VCLVSERRKRFGENVPLHGRSFCEIWIGGFFSIQATTFTISLTLKRDGIHAGAEYTQLGWISEVR